MYNNNYEEVKDRDSVLLRVPAKTTHLLPQSEIYASNLKTFPFDDIGISHDIISSEESEHIIHFLDSRKWVQSISRGRRHQSYEYARNEWINRGSNGEISNEIDEIVQLLEEKIRKRTNSNVPFRSCNEIFIEEFSGAQVGGDVLETEDTCMCHTSECICSVTEVSLLNHGILIFRKPIERNNSCLDCPAYKDTRILVPKNSLFVRTNECLFHWRSTLCADGQYASRDINQSTGIFLPNGYGNLIRDESYRRISIKLRYINADLRSKNISLKNDNVISLPKCSADIQNEILKNLLTIVVTTSRKIQLILLHTCTDHLSNLSLISSNVKLKNVVLPYGLINGDSQSNN